MDVVGSTAMTQHLDPDDSLDIMDNALQLFAKPIKVHSEHITPFKGDGLKAVFKDQMLSRMIPTELSVLAWKS